MLNRRTVTANEDEIVAVAQVRLRFQVMDDEPVELVEVDVGKELTGQVADGDA